VRGLRIAVLSLLGAVLAGCGAVRAHAPPDPHRVRTPSIKRTGAITPMPDVAARARTVPEGAVPVLAVSQGGRTFTVRLSRWPNVILVAPSLYMGPLYDELESARARVRARVVIVAADWPPGTTLEEAERAAAQAGLDRLGWPVLYALSQSSFIPAPTTFVTRGGRTAVVPGVLRSSDEWVALLDSPGLP
jgi:hypothetical protein